MPAEIRAPERFHTSADIFDQSHSWQWRILLASFPTTTGAIVRGVLGKLMKHGRAIGGKAVITHEGLTVTNVRDEHGVWHTAIPIGSIEAVRDSFRRLADHCRLPDHEREALFEELRKWIVKDYRAQSGLDVKRHN